MVPEVEDEDQPSSACSINSASFSTSSILFEDFTPWTSVCVDNVRLIPLLQDKDFNLSVNESKIKKDRVSPNQSPRDTSLAAVDRADETSIEEKVTGRTLTLEEQYYKEASKVELLRQQLQIEQVCLSATRSPNIAVYFASSIRMNISLPSIASKSSLYCSTWL